MSQQNLEGLFHQKTKLEIQLASCWWELKPVQMKLDTLSSELKDILDNISGMTVTYQLLEPGKRQDAQVFNEKRRSEIEEALKAFREMARAIEGSPISEVEDDIVKLSRELSSIEIWTDRQEFSKDQLEEQLVAAKSDIEAAEALQPGTGPEELKARAKKENALTEATRRRDAIERQLETLQRKEERLEKIPGELLEAKTRLASLFNDAFQKYPEALELLSDLDWVQEQERVFLERALEYDLLMQQALEKQKEVDFLENQVAELCAEITKQQDAISDVDGDIADAEDARNASSRKSTLWAIGSFLVILVIAIMFMALYFADGDGDSEVVEVVPEGYYSVSSDEMVVPTNFVPEGYEFVASDQMVVSKNFVPEGYVPTGTGNMVPTPTPTPTPTAPAITSVPVDGGLLQKQLLEIFAYGKYEGDKYVGILDAIIISKVGDVSMKAPSSLAELEKVVDYIYDTTPAGADPITIVGYFKEIYPDIACGLTKKWSWEAEKNYMAHENEVVWFTVNAEHEVTVYHRVSGQLEFLPAGTTGISIINTW